MIALIPARAGSKRIPGKNTKPLGSRPLIRWTVDAAKESKVFDAIYVCTDDPDCIAEALYAGVKAYQRPKVPDNQKDIEWVSEFLVQHPEALDWALLRPTSPFRGPETIKRAYHQWEDCKDRVDSLRAMRRTTETGWKQWVIEDYLPNCAHTRTVVDAEGPIIRCEETCGRVHEVYPTMRPLTTAAAKKHLHSFPTQSLEDTYIQTAGLEMAWTKTVLEQGTIAGQQVGMFLVEGAEAMDINTPDDWAHAEWECISRTMQAAL